MASGRRRSVWDVLAGLGHGGGDRDRIVQDVFESASRVTLRSDGGELLDGGDVLGQVFESLGATKDWPACGSAEWQRLRTRALGIVVRRLAREGLLDAVAVAPFGDETEPQGQRDEARPPGDTDGATDASDGDRPDEVPGIGVEIAAAMIRRIQNNPGRGFHCVRRDTPLRVIWRWAREACPKVSPESLVALKDELSQVAYRDDDGHLLGGILLIALEDELEACCDDEDWTLVVTYYEEAVDTLRRVLTRLALL